MAAFGPAFWSWSTIPALSPWLIRYCRLVAQCSVADNSSVRRCCVVVRGGASMPDPHPLR